MHPIFISSCVCAFLGEGAETTSIAPELSDVCDRAAALSGPAGITLIWISDLSPSFGEPQKGEPAT